MFRLLRRLPFFRVLAIAKIALLARRHLSRLTPDERARVRTLVRRGRHLDPAEKDELRALMARIEPRAFAAAAASALSPVPLPRRLLGGRRR